MKVWDRAGIELASPLDLQTDSHLLPDTLPTALRGPVTSIAKKPNIFCDFPGGPDPPPHYGSEHVRSRSNIIFVRGEIKIVYWP